ncbi:YibE/F family protein [Cellulomonas triticagri]|uniref:YibE/F family protein n=1 Tax=Cellulomonas triticagri TaxID=2483352 RepID=UPI001F1832FD|nr:YibE/F family protein [Cellulomonas triticagri]
MPTRPTPAAATRTRRAIAAILLPLILAAAVGMALTWPHGEASTARTVEAVAIDYPSATVTGTTQEQCEGTVEDRRTDGTIPTTVDCLRVQATVTSGEQRGQEVEVWATAGTTAADVPAGTRILVEHYPATDSDSEVWAWHDYDRTLPLVSIALLFVLAIVLVARTRGLLALVGLVLAFVVIGAYVLPALLRGENAVVVALSASTVIMAVVLYLAHGLSLRTSAALLGTLAGLAATTALGVVAAQWARLSGVSSEDSYRLSQLLGESGATSLRGLFLSGLVLAGLGVLNDVTITQASAVWELRAASPGATRRELFRGGMRIGRDHIASTVYTIAFAYTGAALPVLMLLEIYQLPLGPTLTSGEFAEEIVRTMVSSIGLVLAIPLTTGIAALVVTRSGAAPARHAQPDGHAHAHVHTLGDPDRTP